MIRFRLKALNETAKGRRALDVGISLAESQ